MARACGPGAEPLQQTGGHRGGSHPIPIRMSKVTFFDGNFSEYEEWRRKTLGEAAIRPHRITYRKLTR